MTTRHQHTNSVPPAVSLSDDAAATLAERFKLLADPTRLKMVHLLLESGETCVGAIADSVGISESAASHQLRQLRISRLVKGRKAGREVFYAIADSHVRLLLDLAVEHYLHDHERR